MDQDLEISRLRQQVADLRAANGILHENEEAFDLKLSDARERMEGALRKSEEQYHVLFDSIDEGVTVFEMLFDDEGRAIDWIILQNNPALTRMTGLPPSIVGKRASEVYSALEPYWLETFGRVAKTGEPSRIENYVRELDRWFDCFTTRIGGEGSNRLVGVYNDSTERKRYEQSLKENEERQAFLLKLSDALRPLADGAEIQNATTNLLGEYLAVDRCYYFEADHETDEYVIHRDFKRGELRSLAGRHPIQQWPEMTKALSRGEILAVNDYANSAHIPPEERLPTENLDIAAIILIPLVKHGVLVACMAVIQAVPREWKPEDVALVEDVAERTWGAVERGRAEARLRESEERFQQFAKASSDLLWIRNADTLEMEYVSSVFERIYGTSPDSVLGDVEKWAALVVPDDRQEAMAHLHRARSGKPTVHEFRIRRPSDGVFRWVRDTDFPLLDASGKITRIAGIGSDATEEKLSAEHQAILLAELQHRVRNIMAMIRAVTQRTERSAMSVPDYAALMSGRLMSLARTQALLTRAANKNVEISSLIEAELAAQAHDATQYSLSGPETEISPKAAEVLSLALHELATNALKYGALSVQEGRLSVHWQVEQRKDREYLSLVWSETRPQADNWTPPKRRGFGTELVERRVPYELEGRGQIEVTAQGAQVLIEFPLEPGASILETDAPVRKSVFGGTIDMSDEPSLEGLRVLLLEDDYLLAADAEMAITSAGAEITGPFAREIHAIEAIPGSALDAAVIDINLGFGPSFKTAEALSAAKVPFVFLTGYDQSAIPEQFADVPRFEKPVDVRQVVRRLAQLIERK